MCSCVHFYIVFLLLFVAVSDFLSACLQNKRGEKRQRKKQLSLHPACQSHRSDRLVAELNVGPLTPRTFSSSAWSARVSPCLTGPLQTPQKNKTVIDKTAETRERLNMAASCLSFSGSATRALPLCLPFSFHHCTATNTPFWQRLNCADTLECAGQNGRLVKAAVVYTLPGIIRGGRFSEPINHEQLLHLFDEYSTHRIDVDGRKQFVVEKKAADCCWSIAVAMLSELL